MVKPEIFVTLQPSLRLTPEYQLRLRRLWNERVSDPYLCTPHEKIGSVSLDEVIRENTRLGEFAVSHFKQIFRESSDRDKKQRIEEGKKIVAVGFGRNYDSEWFAEATKAGYMTWWIDVSDVACRMASTALERQYHETCEDGFIYPRAVVKQGEIQSVLADPESIDLNLSSVEVWYLSRILGCLSEPSAIKVLSCLGFCSLSQGADLQQKNRIEIVGALKDYNPGRKGVRSKLYSMDKIIDTLSRGAGRPLEVVHEASCKYFDKVVTAMTIRAR